MTGIQPQSNRRTVLITGGAGFVGCNLAHRLLQEGRRVLLLDNLSRPGVERNLAWLNASHPSGLEFVQGDVRDFALVSRLVRRVDRVFHFAAQVAVTTSLVDPINDFEVNARGTLNLLEAVRASDSPPSLLFTSTNKVYGALEDLALRREDGRCVPVNSCIRKAGVSEARALDFHSPYGCSKGTADQYVRDYGRIYSLRTTVFRMSCIYGPHQFGTEDQGWVAHFLIRALDGEPITLYGDGTQVRDILFVEDLVEAFLKVERSPERVAGQVFNIGGGAENSLSLLELLDLIGELHGGLPPVRYGEWRPGDQPYYVSNTRRFREATGWRPTHGIRDGVSTLYRWLQDSRAAGPEPLAARRECESCIRPSRIAGRQLTREPAAVLSR